MTAPLGVEDIIGYLRNSGWQRQPEAWRGASIWSYGDDFEVLVPARDGMGDGDLRVREIVEVLAAAERRSREQIVHDIRTPSVDTQWIRTFPDGLPAGFTTLPNGFRALSGLRGALRAAARAVMEGPWLVFRGDAPPEVDGLVSRVQLGPAYAGSYALPMRVPLDDPPDGQAVPLGRQVTLRLHNAASVLSRAAADELPLGDLASAEISAELCESLGDLGGEQGELPFEIGFRWARSLPSEVPAATFGFPRGAGEVLRSAAQDLRRRGTSEPATVTGQVLGLRQDTPGDEQWTIEIHGDLEPEIRGRNRRSLWVRLPDRTSYEAAFDAQRAHRRVRVRGVVEGQGRRVELTADPDGFEVLD
jgi:hypothetical protein